MFQDKIKHTPKNKRNIFNNRNFNSDYCNLLITVKVKLIHFDFTAGKGI